MDRALLQQRLAERAEAGYRAGQVWEWAARGAAGYHEMTNIPSSLRAQLEREVPFSTLELVQEAKAKDRTVKALVYLEKAEELDPESVKTHFALARTYRRLGRGEDAARQIEIYERLKEKEPQRAPVPSPTDSPGQ